MNLAQFKIEFTSQLEPYYPGEEVLTFYKLLVAHHLKIDRVNIILKKDLELTKDQLNSLNKNIKSLKDYVPIQYIIGSCSFFGLDFSLNKHVLIPRPETEELVAWVIKAFNERPKELKNKEFSILEFGTGSGCIAISLAKHLPQVKIYGLDISNEALKTARQNAQLNNVHVNFLKVDMLDSLELKTSEVSNRKFDMIVSNPPYVREAEKRNISRNVLDYEPHQALFVSNEHPLIFYKAILNCIDQHLNHGGLCFFEINQALSKETISLIKKYKPSNIELRRDLFGNDRMVMAMF